MGCAAYAAAKNHHRNFLPLSGFFFALPFLSAYFADVRGFWLPALSFTALVYFLSQPNLRSDPFAKLCAARPLIFLGDISYSLYLLQWFVWIGWKHVFAKLPFFATHPYIMVACAAGSLILVSTISYHLFEKPTRAWCRRHLSASKGRTATSRS